MGQKAERLWSLYARQHQLRDEAAKLDREIKALEVDVSNDLGFRCRVSGPQLASAMERARAISGTAERQR